MFGGVVLSKKKKQRAIQLLHSEIEEFNQWQNGDEVPMRYHLILYNSQTFQEIVSILTPNEAAAQSALASLTETRAALAAQPTPIQTELLFILRDHPTQALYRLPETPGEEVVWH